MNDRRVITKVISRWADRLGAVSAPAQARLADALVLALADVAPAPVPCTCGQDDGMHEWDCAIRKNAEGRAPAPSVPVLSTDNVSAIEEVILLAGMHGSTRDLATRASAELEYLHALVDKGRQDSEALESHLSRTYRGRHE